MYVNKKKALVTGGNRGIGAAIVHAFLSKGIDVGIFYYKGEDAAQNLINEARKNNANVKAYKCDLTNIEDIDNAFDLFIRDFGDVDILINNAGTTKATPLLEIKIEEWEELMNLNLRSSFYLSQKSSKYMMNSRWGRIINIGSIGGERLIPGVSAHYAASKAGLSGLTRVMAKELARYNILVNCVAPGLINTALSNYMKIQKLEMFKKIHPLKRMGTTKEVADTVQFLVSNESSYITGETIVVGGGLI